MAAHVRFESQADIETHPTHVRFTPEADIGTWPRMDIGPLSDAPNAPDWLDSAI
jgi:hypothetical protein